MKSKQNNLPNQLLHVALQHHQAGRLREAAEGYQTILKTSPKHSDALHLLGVIFQQQGQLGLAIELMKAAIVQNASIAHYHHNLGNTYLQAERPQEAMEYYRQAILLKPDYYEAHNGIGNALFALQLTEVAADAYRNAVKIKPSFADAHYNLGRMLAKLEKTEEAIACYRAAIQLDSKRADYFFNLGGVFLKQQNHPEALHCYQAALNLQPNDTEILCHLGTVHAAMDNRSEAESFLRKAIALKPDYAAAHLQLGGLLFAMDNRSEAEGFTRKAIVLKPDDAMAYLQLGSLLFAEEKNEESQSAYESALKLDSTLPEALWGLGNLQFKKECYSQAETYYRKALSYKPDYPECHNNLAQALLAQEKCHEAAESYRTAIELNPEYFEAYYNLGIAQIKLNNYTGAKELFLKALEINPDFHEARYNLGNVLKEQDLKFSEAIACYREILERLAKAFDRGQLKSSSSSPLYRGSMNNLALSLSEDRQLEAAILCYQEAILHLPDDGMLHTNLAIALLKSGNLTDGWKEHEWRWKMPDFSTKPRDFGRPLWNGEPLHGATILLHIEQGYGDVLQMIRYIPLIAERGGKVLLESPPTLCRLLKRMPEISYIRTTGEVMPDFAYQCPLMSLPLAFQTTLDTIPSAVPYLSVPEEEIEAAKKLWPGMGLRVGLVWSGNPKHAADAHRSMHLQDMIPLGEVPGVSFYSLQVGERVKQIAEVSSVFPVADVCSQYTDFADTAAFVAGLDLVIAVDTSVAHLAGALGIPVWILLSYVHTDWRWLLNRNDTLWYPSARLFRQPEVGNWTEVIEKVMTELQHLANKEQ